MSKELVCPFCNKKLEPIGTSGQFQCGTWGCDASFNFIATRDVWEYIARTRKALDVAIPLLQEINATCEDNKWADGVYVGLDGHDTRNIAKDVAKGLEQITALEQKDVK